VLFFQQGINLFLNVIIYNAIAVSFMGLFILGFTQDILTVFPWSHFDKVTIKQQGWRFRFLINVNEADFMVALKGLTRLTGNEHLRIKCKIHGNFSVSATKTASLKKSVKPSFFYFRVIHQPSQVPTNPH
jgi:hypothetical protein